MAVLQRSLMYHNKQRNVACCLLSGAPFDGGKRLRRAAAAGAGMSSGNRPEVINNRVEECVNV